MPKITDIGTAGPGNDKIGGVPVLYYYDFSSKGRGEVLRLFFEDAGIAFKDVRYDFDDANSEKGQSRTTSKNPVGSFPYLDINGTIYTQSYPILRYLAGKLGQYDGTTPEEKYFVDVMCDVAIDWRTKFVDSAFVTTKDGLNLNKDKSPFEHHKDFNLPKFIQGVEGHLASSPHGGPFVLGSRITYADLVIYQIYHDEREVGGKIKEILESKAPHLNKLVNAIEARPNIAKYFKSDRYYN